MSVTFTCADAPSAAMACCYCDPDTGYRCSSDCNGTSFETSTAPEVNLSNVNAGDLLRLLGLYNEDGDLWGELPVDEIPDTLRQLLLVLNRANERGHLLVEPSVVYGRNGAGARFIECGRSDERIIRALTALQTLLVFGAENSFDVSWG